MASGRALIAEQTAARRLMPARPIPRRHWRSYGALPLPSGQEALDEPFSAFPSRGSCASRASRADGYAEIGGVSEIRTKLIPAAKLSEETGPPQSSSPIKRL